MQSVKEVVLRKYKQQDCEEMAQLFYDVRPAKLDHTCRCKSGHGNRQ